MTIPSVPLEISIDANELTLDDLEVFEPGSFSVKVFKRFMAAHSNWTAEQVGGLKVSEMGAVADKLRDALQGAAVPKAS